MTVFVFDPRSEIPLPPPKGADCLNFLVRSTLRVGDKDACDLYDTQEDRRVFVMG